MRYTTQRVALKQSGNVILRD